MTVRRREFLRQATLAAGGAFLGPRLALAHGGAGRGRFVLVILRGALDGLAAVPPYGDREYAALRGEAALRPPGEAHGVLALNGFFGLHPALAFLGQSYAAHELIVVHAVASPYRDRSHFDGQDVLENGTPHSHALTTGWLNRALGAATPGAERETGVSLGESVPLVLRGPTAVTSWSPSKLAALDDDTLARITDLYSSDRLLAMRLADGLAADALAAEGAAANDGARMAASGAPADRNAPGMPRAANGAARYAQLAQAAAGFLRQEDGPRVAVFDTLGWDTHANEGGAEGQLAGRLAALDAGLGELKRGLGPVWRDTVVLLVTEFGRTAAVNGTRGTDHGTATVAFLVGGAVAGGRVIADWPGLTSRALYQGRDLAPTVDLRAVMKGVLADHLSVPTRALEQSVFPESGAARPVSDLMRG